MSDRRNLEAPPAQRERFILAALTGYCANPEIGEVGDNTLAMIVISTADKVLAKMHGRDL